MPVLEDKEKIASIQLEIDKYKHELEKIFTKKDIEDTYRSQLFALLNEIEKDKYLFIKLQSENKILESYQKASDMIKKMIRIAVFAEEVEAKEISINRERINYLSLLIRNLIQTSLEIIKNLNKDTIIIVQDITWKDYQNISKTIGEVSWCKISYLDGVLELMSPGLPHEELSENTGEIIKEYCFQKNIKCFAIRSTTLENKKGKKGKQADASYALYKKREIPNIAVEINITSGGIEDLKIYADIGVPEVWMYNDQEKRMRFYLLEKDNYKEIDNSKQLELITSDIVNKILNIGKQGGDINAIRKEVIKFLNSLKS